MTELPDIGRAEMVDWLKEFLAQRNMGVQRFFGLMNGDRSLSIKRSDFEGGLPQVNTVRTHRVCPWTFARLGPRSCGVTPSCDARPLGCCPPQIGLQLTSSDADKLYRVFDPDNDGRIEAVELNDMLTVGYAEAKRRSQACLRHRGTVKSACTLRTASRGPTRRPALSD